MVKMKSIYRKTGMMMAVVALLVAMSAPTAMAVKPGYENIDATWNDPYIVVTVDTFQHNDKWYQFRYYQPGTGESSPDNPPTEGPYDSVTNLNGYFTTDNFVPMADGKLMSDETNYTYTDNTFNVASSGAENTTGEWTVWLFKAGTDDSTPEAIDSDRVDTTVTVPIPEFATIAIPIVALLGIVAFYRRKQKK